MNPPLWMDYKANPGGAYRYRIATIDCDDNNNATTTPYDISPGFKMTYSDYKAAPSLSINPNPAVNGTTISYTLEDGETATVEILDIDGKSLTVLAAGTASSSVELGAGALPAGAYLVKVVTNTGRGVIDKLIVK
jgi:hypothetical protein